MRFCLLRRQAIVALALSIVAEAAPAVSLDFEEFTPAGDACSGALPTTPVATRGFVFAPQSAGTGIAVCASGAAGQADNGSNYLGTTSRVAIAHSLSLPFFLDGLDASVFTAASESRAIVISGAPSGGGASVLFEMVLDATNLTFQPINLPAGFTGVAFVPGYRPIPDIVAMTAADPPPRLLWPRRRAGRCALRPGPHPGDS